MRNNFKTKARTLVSAAALGVAMMVGVSMPANAITTTLNFIDFIDGGGITPTGVGEKGITSTFGPFSNGTFPLDFAIITATGSNAVANGNSPVAYLDGGGAGIGVCQTLGTLNGVSDQCTPSSDDNVTGSPNEILSLAFKTDVRIIQALFRNNGHTPVFGTGAVIDVGKNLVGSSFNTETLDNGATGLGAGLIGFAGLFLTASDTIDFKYNNQQFYLSGLILSNGPFGTTGNVVPLPASVYLFGTGLLGIGFLARRRRRKTQSELKFA